MSTLIVSAPMCVGRGDFIDAWYEQEFATESDFNEAWEAYIQDNLEEAEEHHYDADCFEVYTTSEICTLLNDDYCPSEERWFAPVHIGIPF